VLLTFIGKMRSGLKAGFLNDFLWFYCVFSRPKNEQKRNTDCIECITLYLFVILLINGDATEGLTRDDALPYTICTELIQ
jgi:hypothetical protein